MKLIFAGTPEFAERALSALHAAGHDIALVLSRPDQPAGRGQRLQASPVKQRALALGLPVAQPRTLRDADAHALLAAVGAEQVDVVLHPRGREPLARSGRADGLPSEHVEELGYDPCAITVPLTAGPESLGLLRIRMCTSDACSTPCPSPW